MGAHGFVNSFTIAGTTGDAERVGGVNVTDGFFPTLGVQAALGRLFTLSDDQPDAASTVVLADGFWRRRFAADPSAIGRTLLVNARPATIIGVLPASFRHLEENPDRTVDVFIPYGFNRANANRGGHFIRGVGRLGPGASLAQGAGGARHDCRAPRTRISNQQPRGRCSADTRFTSRSSAPRVAASSWCRRASASCC
jgi:hypothetical protein